MTDHSGNDRTGNSDLLDCRLCDRAVHGKKKKFPFYLSVYCQWYVCSLFHLNDASGKTAVSYTHLLASKWGLDPKAKTPAYTHEDGQDYVPSSKLTAVSYTHLEETKIPCSWWRRTPAARLPGASAGVRERNSVCPKWHR